MLNQQCTGISCLHCKRCVIASLQKMYYYITTENVLLRMSLQKQNCCFANYPSHANWHVASALIFSGTDTWV